MSEMNSALRVYLAGELFDVKHLTGNAMLAEAIEIVSNRRYEVVLPTEVREKALRSVERMLAIG